MNWSRIVVTRTEVGISVGSPKLVVLSDVQRSEARISVLYILLETVPHKKMMVNNG